MVDARFGSLADTRARIGDVRFTPKSMLAHERPRRLQRVTQAILAFGVLSTGSGQSTLYESSGASRFRGICLRAMPQGSESFSIAIWNSDGKRDFANPGLVHGVQEGLDFMR